MVGLVLLRYSVGFIGFLLSVLCKGKVCPAVEEIVGVEDSGGPVNLERGQHHLNEPRRQRVIEADPVVLLDQAGPSEADVLVRQVRLAVDLAALGHDR